MDQQTSQYKCKVCAKSFNSEAELREHQKTCKGSSGPKST
jgi:transposase-like protein